ncbi:MAG: DUF433 domain-containing protein [Bryobacter sp.]|nr:DUF433 domain-containing protein [Bryobacter sp.]
MATKTLATLIEIDEQGRAWIVGAHTKVLEVVMDQLRHGWSVEQMHAEHPHLTLGQLHAALAFYYENQAELDQQLKQDEVDANALAEKLADRHLQQSLLSTRHHS